MRGCCHSGPNFLKSYPINRPILIRAPLSTRLTVERLTFCSFAICGMVLRDGHKGDFFRDGGLLAYGEYVIGEKRVHDVLRGMPFDEPLAVLQH